MARLECSKSTLHRAINSLKDHLNAPVVFDADAGGYRYGKPETGEAFNTVAQATLKRQKLWLEYHARSTNEVTERTVSPQRIVHYREAWYLDAWDEGKDALRSFSIDRIRRATVVDERALDVPEAELDEHYATAYGIFGGKADKVAVLRFTPERARWVADEQWHPQQEGTWLPDGSYELRIPYRESHELVMDIMRQGAGVQVVSPDPLRQKIGDEIRRAAALYLSTTFMYPRVD